MQKVGLINGRTKNLDHEWTALANALLGGRGGIYEWLQVTSTGVNEYTIAPWKAMIKCTRANWRNVTIHFESTTPEVFTITGDQKIFIEINQVNLDNPTANAINGVGIGEIKVDTSFPTDNYIRIDWVVGWVLTGEIDISWIDSSLLTDILSVYATINYVDSVVASLWSIDKFTIERYVAWESLLKWDSVHTEDMFASNMSNEILLLWNISANSRIAVPVYWKWISDDEIKLLLIKYVSPSANIWIRIETDSSNNPSWSLFDPNATATISVWSITTSLSEITATLLWNIEIPKWTKLWLVIYPWTYWSETINAVNYFWVWWMDRVTETRQYKLYNWSSRSYVNDVTASSWHWLNLNTLSNQTEKSWVRISVKENWFIWTITKDWSSAATIWYICDSSWNVIKSAPFVWNTATMNVFVWKWIYIVAWDANGALFNARVNSSWSLPSVWTYIDWTHRVRSGWFMWTSGCYCITSLQFTAFVGKDTIYVNSPIFESSLLSKTNAGFFYKLPKIRPMFVSENYNQWDIPVILFDWALKALTWLTKDYKYYLWSNPWEISILPWWIKYDVWYAIDESLLLIQKDDIVQSENNATISSVAPINSVVSVDNIIYMVTSSLATYSIATWNSVTMNWGKIQKSKDWVVRQDILNITAQNYNQSFTRILEWWFFYKINARTGQSSASISATATLSYSL